jgi:hypothetical protein
MRRLLCGVALCCALVSAAASAEGRFRLVSELLGQAGPELGLTPEERRVLEDQLASHESWRTVGKVFTYTGIAAGGLGVLLMGLGVAGYWAGAFSLNIGELAGGALLFNMGVICAGVGIVGLAVGIPIWVVSSGRAERVKARLGGSRPFVSYDPLTRVTTAGWAFSF